MKKRILAGMLSIVMTFSLIPKVGAEVWSSSSWDYPLGLEKTISKEDLSGVRAATLGPDGLGTILRFDNTTDVYQYFNKFDGSYYSELSYDYLNEVATFVANNIEGDFNLNKYLTNDEIKKLYATIYEIADILKYDSYSFVDLYNFESANYINYLDLYSFSGEYYEYINATETNNIYSTNNNSTDYNVDFKLNDLGIERLEKLFYKFDYQQYINNMNEKSTFSIYAFGNKNGINISNTGVHSLVIADDNTYGGGYWPYFDLTGYTVGDILYVNFNKLFHQDYGEFEEFNKYDSYMMFLMTDDEDYPFQLIKSGEGSNDRVDIIAYVEETFSPNVTFEDTVYNAFTTFQQFIDYLIQRLNLLQGNEPNDKGLLEIENYIKIMQNKMPTVNVEISGNQILILENNFDEIVQNSEEYYNQVLNILSNYNVKLQDNTILETMPSGLSNILVNGIKQDLENVLNYEVLDMPNVEFDYKTYAKYSTNEEFLNYISEILGNVPKTTALTIRDVNEIQEYLSYFLRNLEIDQITSTDNKVEISLSNYQTLLEKGSTVGENITDLLNKYNISLTKDINNYVTLYAEGIDIDSKITFNFNYDLEDLLEEIDGIKIVFSEAGHSILLTSYDLLNILAKENFFEFDLEIDDDSIIFTAYNDRNNEVTEANGQVNILLPTTSETASVFRDINNTMQNWGGIFNEELIQFATSFSGEYVIEDVNITINDISNLSEDLQEKVEFLVSKGLFSVDENGNFRPDGQVERYHFVTALVRMFFAQDENAKSNFTDVLEDNFYYEIVSAGTEKNIVQGYEDNTFRGSNLITRQEIIAFMARTLAEQKGYSYPKDYENSLSIFSDNDAIADWAKADIALALEHGLINYYGNFEPSKNVTRVEALELLYTLFMKLYEVPEATTYNINDIILEENAEEGSFSLNSPEIILISAVGGGLLLLILCLVLIMKKRKKSTEDIKPQIIEETVPADNINQNIQNAIETVNLPNEIQEISEEYIFCEICGNKQLKNSGFCGKCGNKIN